MPTPGLGCGIGSGRGRCLSLTILLGVVDGRAHGARILRGQRFSAVALDVCRLAGDPADVVLVVFGQPGMFAGQRESRAVTARRSASLERRIWLPEDQPWLSL